MKVEPVYLVAPFASVPSVPSIPTRRAFVVAVGAFLAGTTIGGACGYSAGAAGGDAAKAAAKPTDQELPKSGDHELDQLRWLAVKAPLDELFAKAPMFLGVRVLTYPNDIILWEGVARLSREIVDNPARPVDQMVIAMIVGQIKGPAHPATPSLQELVPALQARREQAKRSK